MSVTIPWWQAIQLWLEVAEEDARREAEAEQGVLEEVTI